MVWNQKILIYILLVAIVICQHPHQQPVIGIYTQDADDYFNLKADKENTNTYISASYVKNMQMAGAQVIPIFYHYSLT
jgi:hypothetical protein